MKRSLFILTLLSLFSFSFSVFSQTAPHIQGKVFVDINTGLFRCDFTLSNLELLKEYSILINKGMNIKTFQDANQNTIGYDGFYDGKMKGEAIEYTLIDKNRKPLSLPKSFRVSYVGAFPRYVDSYNAFDFKGFIAINDETIRATEQTKWYPVIYDAKEDRKINNYTYNIEVELVGGTSIFLNGSAPKKAQKAMFTSQKAVPLLLFAGNFDFVESEGNYIINANIEKEQATKVFENVKLVQDYLAESLDQTFDGNIYLINHKAVNKRRGSWGFNTYPTFAFTGKNMFKNILTKEGKFDNNSYRYFGHEFAHNYFGNNVQSGVLYWFWLESFPEYLSFTFAEKMGGKAFLNKVLESKFKSVEKRSYVPLPQVKDPNQVNGSYRYNMGPLILLSFDLQFGRERAFDVLKKLLAFAETETLTLNHLKRAAIESGVSSKAYKTFAADFIESKDFKKNTLRFLKSKVKK